MSLAIKSMLVLLSMFSGLESAGAAVIWTARDSVLNANYVFGAAADVSSDNVTDTSTSLTDRFDMVIADSDSDAGVVLGQPWSAAITYSAGHAFQVLGSPLNLDGFSSNGQSTATTSYTGGASIGVNVRAPGNSWAVEFEVTSPVQYVLQGSVTDSGTRNTTAVVALERFAIVWAGLEILRDDPNFYETGELSPGRYRVIASAAAVSGFDVASAQSGWDLQMSFVPIPAAAWLFISGMGLVALPQNWRRLGC